MHYGKPVVTLFVGVVFGLAGCASMPNWDPLPTDEATCYDRTVEPQSLTEKELSGISPL